MRTRFALVFAVVLITGCVSPSQMLVGPQNTMVHCSAVGFGIIGAPVAHHSFSNCVDDFKSAGYLPIEEAGVVGVHVDPALVIVTVVASTPASTAGILTGDKLIQVNGQPVTDQITALKLMFGKVGETVTLTVHRNDKDIPFTMVRAARKTD
jgi:S1-C subfamily serine protease